jgi:hypothetical protein
MLKITRLGRPLSSCCEILRFRRRIRIRWSRFVSGLQRQVLRLGAPRHRKRIDDIGVLFVLPFNESLDGAVRILVVFCGRCFDILDFLLSCRDIGGDGVLGDHDGGRCVIAPRDRIGKLPGMILHRLSGSLDSRACGFRGVA